MSDTRARVVDYLADIVAEEAAAARSPSVVSLLDEVQWALQSSNPPQSSQTHSNTGIVWDDEDAVAYVVDFLESLIGIPHSMVLGVDDEDVEDVILSLISILHTS